MPVGVSLVGSNSKAVDQQQYYMPSSSTYNVFGGSYVQLVEAADTTEALRMAKDQMIAELTRALQEMQQKQVSHHARKQHQQEQQQRQSVQQQWL